MPEIKYEVTFGDAEFNAYDMAVTSQTMERDGRPSHNTTAVTVELWTHIKPDEYDLDKSALSFLFDNTVWPGGDQTMDLEMKVPGAASVGTGPLATYTFRHAWIKEYEASRQTMGEGGSVLRLVFRATLVEEPQDGMAVE